jgi:hypothetical protein
MVVDQVMAFVKRWDGLARAVGWDDVSLSMDLHQSRTHGRHVGVYGARMPAGMTVGHRPGTGYNSASAGLW